MEKQKSKLQVHIFVLIVGIVYAVAGIYFLINGICTYINQFDQKDWPVTTATVINADEYRSGRKHRSTRYDIIYQYETDKDIYTGKLYRSNAPKKIGDTFEIKYNPDAPYESTQYTRPTFGIAVSGAIGFCIFGCVGFCLIKRAFGKRNRLLDEREK